MTSQSFHLVMLMLIGAMSIVSWHGYRFEPWDRKTALKWNAVAAAWFGYLLWKGVPEIIEPSYIRSGLAVFAFVLALNARRLLLGFELLVIKHWAGPAIFSALRSNEPISADVPIRLGDRSGDLPIPGLRTFINRRQAALARAIREKVNEDALLAEAIVRREKAREEAAALKARRRAAPDEWRQRLHPQGPISDRRRYLSTKTKKRARKVVI
jgi:hypothetical protein